MKENWVYELFRDANGTLYALERTIDTDCSSPKNSKTTADIPSLLTMADKPMGYSLQDLGCSDAGTTGDDPAVNTDFSSETDVQFLAVP